MPDPQASNIAHTRSEQAQRASPISSVVKWSQVQAGNVGVWCFSDAMYASTSSASAAEPDSGEEFMWPRDRFYDRAGCEISISHWATLRGDSEYTTIGDWCDVGGSVVRTVWTGFGYNYGHSDSLIFETHSIVGDEALFSTYCTEAAARRGHDDTVQRIASEDHQEGHCTVPPGVTIGAVEPPRFLDREGTPVTLAQWARLRRDPGYCLIDRWRGEGGAHIEVYWVGCDPSPGFNARRVSFGLSVAAFENCPLPDSDYRFFTEARALDHFHRIVPLVERGVRPWDDEAVVAAGFEPLVLRAW